MEIGDIILRKGQGVSRIVGWFTNSPYTHVGIVYDEPIIIHSYIKGVRPTIKKDLEPYDVYRLKGGLDDVEKEVIQHMLENFMRKDIKYDYWQLVFYVYYALFGGDNKFNNPKKFICSELIDRAYKSLSYHITKNDKLGDITPAEIARSSRVIKVKEGESNDKKEN